MATSFLTTYAANKLLDKTWGATDFTPAATWYCILYTAAPNVSGGGTEVTGGTYARVGLTNNSTNFPNASTATKQNGVDIDFTTTLPSCTIVGAGWIDNSSGGNLWYYADFASPYIQTAGAPFKISANNGQWQIVPVTV